MFFKLQALFINIVA